MEISPTDIFQLNQIFQKNRWAIEDEFGSPSEDYKNIINMIAKQKPNWRELTINLLRDYKKIGLDSQVALCSRALNSFLEKFGNDYDRIILVPLISPKEPQKVKSGYSLINPVDVSIKKGKSVEFKNKILATAKTDGCLDALMESKNVLVVALDDFVGSGTTACIFNDHFQSYYAGYVGNFTILVCCAAMMKNGQCYLQQEGVRSIAGLYLDKGIECSNFIKDKNEAYKIMDEIEEILHITGEFKYGFGQAESLVTLHRTPDTTFPLFWRHPQLKGYWDAPFPRE